ncbi:kinesin-4-like isoform X1 [Canna indica]|uniref:Kinesin-4-like isoform X1 n=1 Tax=Canna indica TaxID=4628 RepID=A0AAQ3KD91_9LILI|nr:kinesin-4-like isoform X1 [Canna indica]
MNVGTLLDLPIGDSRESWRSDDWGRQGMTGQDMDAEMAAKRRSEVIEWLNTLFPGLNMAREASEEELRARLLDGALLCGILKKFNPGHSEEITTANRSEKIRKFITAVEQTGLPNFRESDLEQGSMSAVVCCLWFLKNHLVSDHGEDRNMTSPVKRAGEVRGRWRSLESRLESLRGDNNPIMQSSAVFGEQRRNSFHESRLQRLLRSPVMSEPSTPPSHPASGHKFHEVFQLKQGRYYDIPAAKITEMMKSNSLDNAPTQSLLSVMNGILDESIERKNGEIPHRVACLLRKVVQEIERRISTQAEHIRNQNNLIKTREEKYQSRIRVLETLANGTTDETQVTISKLKQEIESLKRTYQEQLMGMNTKEQEMSEHTISKLKQEIESLKKTYGEQLMGMNTKEKENNEQTISKLKQEIESLRKRYQEQQMGTITKEKESEQTISKLKQEIKTLRKTYQEQQMVTNMNEQTSSKLNQEIETLKKTYEEQLNRMGTKIKEMEKSEQKVSELNQEIDNLKTAYEEQLNQMMTKATEKDKSEDTISKLKQEIETLKKRYEEQLSQMGTMAKEKEKSEETNSKLKQEIEILKKTYEEQSNQMGNKAVEKEKSEETNSKLKQEIETLKKIYEEHLNQMGTKVKEKEKSDQTISELKQEIDTMKKAYEEQLNQMGANAKEKEKSDQTISELKQEIDTMKKAYEEQLNQMGANAKEKKKSDQTISELKQEIDTIMKAYEAQSIQMGTKAKEKEKSDQKISELKQEIDTIMKAYEEQSIQMGTTAKEKEKSDQTISELKHEMDTIKKAYEEQSIQMVTKAKEKEKNDQTILELEQEIRTTKKMYEKQFQQMETKEKESRMEFEKKLNDLESFLAKSQRKIKELETVSESNLQKWKQKECVFLSYVDGQLQSVQELRSSSDSIKNEVDITRKRWSEEVTSFGKQLKVLTNAVENYHSVLAENRKLYNEIQELKGNIRVYCRVRPFLPGENGKQNIVDYIGENGEIAIVNPSKQGKDAPRLFKFNKVFGQTSTQEEVYLDTQSLVRSVLDGYNVCIFAYGQTGSGKTYTMTGPDIATEKEWGVNYRALNDLFNISLKRRDTYMYEVGVQMVEIYNEQIRDLLGTGGSQKKYPLIHVLVSSQATGLAVPDASMLPVKSTSDVLDLMQLGHNNRSVSATSQNERSSRSHSIVTIHVRGTDLKSGSTLRGSLHLVDLAGSERVDRSEVTGDRLKEAQHINKSLSALGDVIFALSQKSSHIPYRNSKLTQVLQSSLGGHAKTLMFVQINPEIASFSESLSTLKFAERVSGVELGAAKSQKEGKDIRDLMEQVASLKDTIARKDDEIDQLQQMKDGVSNSLRHSPSSPRISMLQLDDENDPDHNEDNSADADSEEKLSDTSDGGHSMGAETDSVGSLGENNTLPEQGKSSETTKEKVSKTPSRVSKPLAQKTVQAAATRTKLREPLKSPAVSGLKKSTSQATLSPSKPSRLQGKAPVK